MDAKPGGNAAPAWTHYCPSRCPKSSALLQLPGRQLRRCRTAGRQCFIPWVSKQRRILAPLKPRSYPREPRTQAYPAGERLRASPCGRVRRSTHPVHRRSPCWVRRPHRFRRTRWSARLSESCRNPPPAVARQSGTGSLRTVLRRESSAGTHTRIRGH